MKLDFLHEAFQKLNEETFDADIDGLKELSTFRNDSDNDIETEISVIDDEATTEEDLKDSYVGKIIVECPICHSYLFKAASAIDCEDGEELCNTTDECPYCCEVGGFTIIGLVAPYKTEEEESEEEKKEPAEEEKVEEPVEEPAEEPAEEEVSVEEVEDKEEVEESLTEGKCENCQEKKIEERLNDCLGDDCWDSFEYDSEDDNSPIKVYKNDAVIGNYQLTDDGIYDLDKNESIAPKDKQILIDAKCEEECSEECKDCEDGKCEEECQKECVESKCNKSHLKELFEYDKDSNGIYHVEFTWDDAFDVACWVVYNFILPEGIETADVQHIICVDTKNAGKELNIPVEFVCLGDDEDDIDESIKEEVTATIETDSGTVKVDDDATEIKTDAGVITTTGDEITIKAEPEVEEQPEEEIPAEEVAPVDADKVAELAAEEAPAEEVAVDEESPAEDAAEEDVATEEEAPAEEKAEEEAHVEEKENDEKEDEEDVDVDFDEIEEESFNALGTKFLNRVYENVESFTTTSAAFEDETHLKLEGVIKFKSGKESNTAFIFESKDITSTGKARLIGENQTFAKGKKPFTMVGTLKDGNYIAESLSYNFSATTPKGTTARISGTVNNKD